MGRMIRRPELLAIALLLPFVAPIHAAERPVLHLPFETLNAVPCDDAELASGVNGRALQLHAGSRCDAIDLGGRLGERFTIALWASASRFPDADGASFNDAAPVTLVSLRDGEGQSVAVLRITVQRLEFAYLHEGGWSTVKADVPLKTDQWYHCAVESDGEQLRLLVNGRAAAISAAPGPIAGSKLELGRWGGGRKFLGRLDELVVYRRALGDDLRVLIEQQNRGGVELESGPAPAGHSQRFGLYPALRVSEDVVHPLVVGLSQSTTALPWLGPDAPPCLLTTPNRNRFGTRTALYRPVNDPGELPIYDAGETLEALPGAGHQVVPRPDGRFDLIANGSFSAYDDAMLIYLRNVGEPGTPRFAEPTPVWINGGDLNRAVSGKAKPQGWCVGDVDGDGVVDLLLHAITYAAPANPDGASFWNRKEKPNQGKGRGYGIGGQWLGYNGISRLLWAKGARDERGALSFAEPKIVHAGYPGFAVQWKATAGNRATCVMRLDGRPHVIVAGDIDRVLVMPVRMVGDELYADDTVDLLAGGARLLHTYYPTRLTPTDLDGDGRQELLVDGNPGRLAVLKGNAPGNFVEADTIRTRGGPVAVDLLANPCRTDWDGDGRADLLVGDSSGFLTFWPGTDNPTVYGEPVYMRSAGEVIHHQAGYGGSIQGPTERRWGYLNQTVGDWDGDGVTEIIANDVNSELYLYGRTSNPHELKPRVRFTMDGKPYAPAWRTLPAIVPAAADYGGSSRTCLLHLDWDGDLAMAVPASPGSTSFERVDKLRFASGETIRLCGPDGHWGRTKFAITDWDGDGDWDVLFGTNAALQPYFVDRQFDPGEATPFLLENVGSSSKPAFAPIRPILRKGDEFIRLGGHNVTPWPTDLDGDGELDLIVGTEDGKVYYFLRSELMP